MGLLPFLYPGQNNLARDFKARRGKIVGGRVGDVEIDQLPTDLDFFWLKFGFLGNL